MRAAASTGRFSPQITRWGVVPFSYMAPKGRFARREKPMQPLRDYPELFFCSIKIRERRFFLRNLLRNACALALALATFSACSSSGMSNMPSSSTADSLTKISATKPGFRMKPHSYSFPYTYWGVNIPLLTTGSGWSNGAQCNGWTCMLNGPFSPSVFKDIANNLHANFVRTTWDAANWNGHPGEVEHVIANACAQHLGTLLIFPGPGANGDMASYKNGVNNFLNDIQTNAHYTTKGCITWAELANEPNLADNAFDADVNSYVQYYEALAPMIAETYNIQVITGGAWGYGNDSGFYCGPEPNPPNTGICGKYWVDDVSLAVEGQGMPLHCYGFHPYDAFNDQAGTVGMGNAMNVMDNAPTGFPKPVCVTEMGDQSGSLEATAISQLYRTTELVTIFEYEYSSADVAPSNPTHLWLVDQSGNHAPRYAAVQQAFSQYPAPSPL